MNKFFALVCSALLFLALGSVAFAHAEIVECTPKMNGVVETAPEKLYCEASQAMEATGSSLRVFDANGAQVDKGDSAVDLNDPERTLISVSLDTAKMSDGVYTVKWTTVSADDGDQASGEFKFTVGKAEEHSHAEGETHDEGDSHDEGDAHDVGDSHDEGGTHQDDHSIASGTIDGQAVTLQIVAPAKDAALTAGEIKVEAKVEGITLGANDTHLHFYVNGKLAGMGEGAQTSYMVNLDAGEHDLEVALAVGDHGDVLKAHVHVTVQAAAATSPAPSESETQTLPATGGELNMVWFAGLALLGAAMFGAGAFVTARARRKE